jgi:hypothetical protein
MMALATCDVRVYACCLEGNTVPVARGTRGSPMSDRTPEQILVEWRDCERRHADLPTPELAARIEQLRAEHAAAMRARQVEADELAELSPLRSS